MEVTDARLAASIRFCKLEDVIGEDAQEKALFKSLYLAASIYLEDAGIVEPVKSPELYYLAVDSLTLYYYDHRDAIGNEAAFPVGLRPIINQLKHKGIALAAASAQ